LPTSYMHGIGSHQKKSFRRHKRGQTDLPGWGNRLRERHCAVLKELNEGGVNALAAAEREMEQTASVYLAVPVWESGKRTRSARTGKPSSLPRLNCLARMPVRYISGDVRQSTVFYAILDTQDYLAGSL
jgi:hypothetical protein